MEKIFINLWYFLYNIQIIKRFILKVFRNALLAKEN